MKNNSIRRFLTNLKIFKNKKHFFFEINLTKTNKILTQILTKEGFLRGFFFKETKNILQKIYIIPKYNDLDLNCFFIIKKKALLDNKLKTIRKKNVKKFCNGIGFVLFLSIKKFIGSENLFWLKLGGKKIFELI